MTRMLTREEIEALAALARIKIPEGDVDALRNDIDAILSYVSEIEAASTNAPEPAHAMRNVMREDVAPHEAGAFSEALLRAAPSAKDGYLTVKKIITKD